uniref:Uncharacterized protein n=1 Tax=Fagus sylvatica TaxID=28930 RepID=A0A2N9JBC4_FAGSY
MSSIANGTSRSSPYKNRVEVEVVGLGLISEESRTFLSLWDLSKTSYDQGSLELGLSQWKVHALAAMKELQTMILRGGGMFTLAKIYEMIARRVSGKVYLEAANYQIKKEFIKKVQV